MVALPPSLLETRGAVHRVATHVLARAQFAATERIGLRSTPGGLGTAQFGDSRERLRISHGVLVRETGSPPATRTIRLSGATLAELATFAGVELSAEFSVGHDTPPLGDPDEPLAIDDVAVGVMGEWYALTAQALDQVAASRDCGATIAQLWPEHFDLAYDVAYDSAAPHEHRANLGGAPGDGFLSEPYLYVGPWTSDRPGDPAFWNAPFGAVLTYGEVASAPDPLAAAVGFFESGLAALAS